MFKRLQHIIVLALLLFGVKETSAQMAMPDHVCVGTTKTYSVNDPSVPSTYTWKIDGVTQATTTNEITITWNTPGEFLITVQERSADGCEGDIRSGTVYVYPPAATSETITICETQLPYIWNGQNLTEAGTATATLQTVHGCDSVITLTLIVIDQVTPQFNTVTNLCINATAPVLPTTSLNGITGTWSPAVINTSADGTSVYTFTPDPGQCATTATLNITVNPNVVPAFDPIDPICSGATAPVLPTTSNNGITGTWSPATVSNTTSATYTFTPNAGQCATTTTLNITVSPNIVPAFDAIAPICEGVDAPTLPTTSTNNITGTWSPAAVDNTTSATYTFTPDPGQCATTTTLTITVTPTIVPTFSAIAPICEGADAPTLPTTSTNNITGTWSPATVDNTTSATYTFTPDAGQCATTTTLDITVSPSIAPTFDAIDPICSGAVAPTLPTTSTNNITGTWSPATVSNTTSATYTFTPASGQCATTTTLTITVTPTIVPTFSAIAPICEGVDAPTLPTTSTNNITGTWNPATIDNTTSATYTFTPDAGQCATTATLNVTVNPNIVPTFNAIAPICSGAAAPTLPTTSTNNITGTWSPATVDNTTSATYTFTPDAGQCATTTTLNITVNPSIVPTFDAIDPICSGTTAPILPTTSINGITGTWSPATVSNTTSATYTFTPASGQCATTTTLTITVTPTIVPTFSAIAPICEGADAPTLPTTSTNNITGTWSPATVDNTTSATYTFTPDAGQCATTTTLNITVNPNIVPTFNAIAPICAGAAAPTLPTISNNGITGTWNPATIDNTTSATYTFTPDAGQCATTTTLDITVNPSIIPTFDAIDPICSGASAPTLPTTSTNNITGTWSPATVSNTTSATYTFTPSADQCATITTLTVTVTDLITPTFDAIDNVCQNATAPVLPTSSTNGISGTWSSTVSTATPGTTTYTFTPDAGQCAAVTTVSVTVDPLVTPTFNAIPNICQNATAPVLPTTSVNGITGTWSPAVSTGNPGTTTYTFTPDEGQCATTTTLDITVTDLIEPTFDAIVPICANAAAPILPNTSTNNITGTWSPATVSNTASGTYTFTPNAGQCATTTTITISVNPIITPTFDAIAAICSGNTAPVLPTTSNNGINGTWSPATVSNTTSATYTFTPEEGQCAVSVTLNVAVTDPITPTFNPIPAICQNATAPELPTTSLNGITGTWNPAVVSNNADGTYTFIPDDGQCAATTTITVTVTDQITPVFENPGPFCLNSSAPALPAVSSNGISGTWSPASISTADAGTTDYIFTPDEGQCGTVVTMSITIADQVTPTFNGIAPLCQNSTPPTLPTTSINNISGTWSPAVINTDDPGTTVYTFTPDADECGSETTLSITIEPRVTPTFDLATTICANSPAPILPGTSDNGITGTWSPATVSNTTTATYTFTPHAGQCAEPTTVTITVNPNITPDFDAIAPICSGDEPPVLPTVSNNGITGTWSPATVSNTASANYTFTPDADQCATTQSLTITVQPQIAPVFNAIPAICSGDIAPILPTTSLNGITGTWSPSSVSNTASGVYTFIPDGDQCATTTTLTVTVTDLTEPTFDAIADVCQNSTAPVLPTTSINGITGTWNPAVSTATPGTRTYTFTPNGGQCATTTTLTITVDPLVTPTFTPVDNVCQNSAAPVLPTTSINGITGTWSPAVNTDVAGTTTYTFTPDAGQCATTTALSITVDPLVTPTFTPVDDLCQNGAAPVLPTTSLNGITGTWSPAVSTATPGTTTYTFTPDAGQCAEETTITVTVNPNITPAFDAVAPICSGDESPVLPTVSNNGVTGTWNPATVSNTTSAIYTFTPDPGQCASTTTLSIVVDPLVTPTFTPVDDVCQNSTAPVLPTTSINGITGTWSPAVSTATPGTTTYTFTPDAGQCASTTTLSISVDPIVTPTFTPVDDVCENSAAPVLPTTSINGITGTWSPAVSTATPGTTTYTFTPDDGQCATTTTLSITVDPLDVPTFDAIADICQNSAAPVLPTTSNNGITGTWSPAVSTATPGTTTYTFTPDAGQCATTTTLTITVDPLVTPTFTPVDNVCQNSAAPVLPTTSINGITGTWSPAVNTDVAGTTTYTFTPDAGQCATTTALSITVDPLVTPTFTPVDDLCQNGAAPVLPTTSLNGITGTWSPAVSTATPGTTTYTFTPDAGQCATTTTLNITVDPLVTPTFTAVDDVCQNSTAPVLPTTSINGITGTWSPAVNTSTPGTTTYTFTPDAGQCSTTTTLNITVDPLVTPTFMPVDDVCQNSTAPVLPTTSINGITGSWSPAVNTAIPGTTTYTFTPDAGQCATTTTLSITVDPLITPTFTPVDGVCQNSAAPVLPTTSINGITGTWSPAVSTATPGTTTYTFTPDAGQCAEATTITVTVNPNITPDFDAVAPICSGDESPVLPTVSNNGITGTWNPAIVSNTTSANYTFTPDPGQCASTTTLSITVDPSVIPTFTPVDNVCENSTAPVLPTTSINGITGTWSPAVSTASAGTTTYTFTPEAGQCATTATLTITVDPLVTPTFTPVDNVCQNSTAPVLPTTSLNGITGTWSPAVSTAGAGTTTYTFTPEAGQCASTTTLSITVDPLATPTFTPVDDVCQNSAAPVLPTTSLNGITGTWSPAVSTATPGTTTYTFTPEAGQCATTTTLTITVDPLVTPTFTPVDNVCQNSTAPVLPTTSLNGITGTWSPAVSTAGAGTTTYTFTPEAGQCASTTTLSITVDPLATPTFTPVDDVCQNSAAPVLPTTSINGITGTWSPAVNTDVPGTTTYTFTPDAGQCATTTALSITVDPLATPTFTPVDDVCQNSKAPDLPTTSINGIIGTWNPAVSTATPGTTTYTFTPGPGQCAGTATLTITVNPVVTGEETITICEGQLPYSWNGQSITTAGDYTADLTSTAGCDSTATLHLIVNPVVTGEETITICEGQLPYSWNGQSITTAGDYTADLTSTAGCDSTATLHLIVNPVVTGEETITICEGQLPYSWNGQSITTAGDYTADLTSTAGCDSTATLHLIVNPVVTGEETITICEGQLPYSWNGQSITTAGDYTADLTSTAGCDSTATLHLIVNPVVTGEETITICEGQLPYSWNGQSITTAGDYTADLTSTAGCDSTATLHLIVNPVVTGEETITICEGQLPYSWNGQSITTAGDYTADLTSTAGCDSTATLHLIVNPVVTGEETITICEGQLPYSWNGQSITTAGDYTADLTSTAGCDSTATLHLIVNPVVTGEETITICEGQLPYSWNGQSITTAGDYTADLTSTAGCDSTATLHLIVNPVVTGEETITICEGQLPYSWNGQSITTAGDYTADL
ncbi:beta strand repeat-containing protein, partial [Terrimonas alba]|uniref:beta strand repeat-containing protein n=1 Tax=Terrimonas alba TaxID=3349636 RepID=UPI0035F2EE98